MIFNSKKNIILVVFLIFLFLFFLFFVCMPLIEIGRMSKEIKSQKNNLALLDIKIKNLAKFKDVSQELEDMAKEINGLFIDLEVPLEFINFIEKTIRECSLKREVFSISPQNNPNKDTWSFLSFQLGVSGAFPDFLKFLDKLENNPYLIDVKNIHVSKLGDKATSTINSVRADLEIKVFAR